MSKQQILRPLNILVVNSSQTLTLWLHGWNDSAVIPLQVCEDKELKIPKITCEEPEEKTEEDPAE